MRFFTCLGYTKRVDVALYVKYSRSMTKHPVKDARAKLGISQMELARRLSVTQATVSRWESCDAKKLPRLARILFEQMGQADQSSAA